MLSKYVIIYFLACDANYKFSYWVRNFDFLCPLVCLIFLSALPVCRSWEFRQQLDCFHLKNKNTTHRVFPRIKFIFDDIFKFEYSLNKTYKNSSRKLLFCKIESKLLFVIIHAAVNPDKELVQRIYNSNTINPLRDQ